MARYLTNKETQATLEKIIIQAEKKLILISPYIKLTNTMLARIRAAAEKGVVIKIIFRANKVDKGELERLKTIKNVDLKSTDDLHAKCYFNEKEMIVTSLNLLETSEKNWEMGIYINRSDDKEMYEAAYLDARTIFGDSNPITQNTSNLVNLKPFVKGEKTKIKTKSYDKGYCIRCEEKISLNPDKPYCTDCYTSWNKYKNYQYEENVCHSCGENEYTTMIEPMCADCE